MSGASFLDSIAHPDTFYVDRAGISPGNFYCYFLNAQDSAGNSSGFSDTVCVGLPIIDETSVPPNVDAPVSIPLTSIFSDPDDPLIDLSASFSMETNCSVAIVSNDLVITPIPDFLGAGSFYVRLDDPAQFWDGKTIAFSIDSRDLTPPSAPTNVVITR
ncbi:MAG: hypothetical protein ACW99Q_24595 [Candidatus Kariarchaeaceae archaeon]